MNGTIKITVILILLLFPLQGYALDVGDIVPDFHIVTIEGKEISFEKDIKGKKPVYLIFRATW